MNLFKKIRDFLYKSKIGTAIINGIRKTGLNSRSIAKFVEKMPSSQKGKEGFNFSDQIVKKFNLEIDKTSEVVGISLAEWKK